MRLTIRFIIIALILCATYAIADTFKPQTNISPENGPNTQQQSLNLDSSQFGLFGPFSFGGTYSDQFGGIVNLGFANRLGSRSAFALQTDLGNREYRFSGTFGLALTTHQRIKITAEQLEQKLDFDFASGNIRHWVGQFAFAGTYQYLLPNTFLTSTDVSGYYAKAQSDNLATKLFTTANGTYLDYRRIAGATSKGFNGGIHIKPWATGLIDLALNYDSIHFNTHYSKANNTSGFGGTISLQQLITQRLKLNALFSHRDIFKQYQIGLDWLAITSPFSTLELDLNATRTQGRLLPTGHDNRINLVMNYSWGNHHNLASYSAPTDGNHQDLLGWTRMPAVRMPDVIAMKDEKIVKLKAAKRSKHLLKSKHHQFTINVPTGKPINIHLTKFVANKHIDVSQLPKQLHFNAKTDSIKGKFNKTNANTNYSVNITPIVPLNSMLPLQTPTKLIIHVTDANDITCDDVGPQDTVFRVADSPISSDQIPIVCKSKTGQLISYNKITVRNYSNALGLQFIINIHKNLGLITGPKLQPGIYHVIAHVSENNGAVDYAQPFTLVILNTPTAKPMAAWIATQKSYNDVIDLMKYFQQNNPNFSFLHFYFTLASAPSWLSIDQIPSNNYAVIKTDGPVPANTNDTIATVKGELRGGSISEHFHATESLMLFIDPETIGSMQTESQTLDADTSISIKLNNYFNPHIINDSSKWSYYVTSTLPSNDVKITNNTLQITTPNVNETTDYKITVNGTKSPTVTNGASLFPSNKTVTQTSFTITVKPTINAIVSCPTDGWDSNTHTQRINVYAGKGQYRHCIGTVGVVFSGTPYSERSLCENNKNFCRIPSLSGSAGHYNLSCYYHISHSDTPFISHASLAAKSAHKVGMNSVEFVPNSFQPGCSID